MPGTAPTDAEDAAAYVVERVAARAGSRLRQGAWPAPLADRPLGLALDLVATYRLRGISLPVARALVEWGQGRRRAYLLAHVPRAAELLLWQAEGWRCVSLLPDGADPTPHADGLAFVAHDLCHLEKFVDPAHHLGQVGFFRAVHDALHAPGWASFMERFDLDLATDLEHVVADMNGSAVFLFAALKMKLKMAVRRRVARAGGRQVVHGKGPLDDHESAAFRDELACLLDHLSLRAEVREAATSVSTRRDDASAARLLLDYFESVGADARWRAVS